MRPRYIFHFATGTVEEITTMTFPEWAHRFDASTTAPASLRRSPGDRFAVTAGLHFLSGNTRPYFSVTGWCGPTEEHCHTAGCMHDAILLQWPDLAPVVRLHLSDDTGLPMHAEANSWYQLAGYYGGAGETYHAGNAKSQHWNDDGTFNGYRESSPDECLAAFADYVRISPTEAYRLADTWKETAGSDWRLVRALFAAWLADQKDRFQSEADAAIAVLDALIARKSSYNATH